MSRSQTLTINRPTDKKERNLQTYMSLDGPIMYPIGFIDRKNNQYDLSHDWRNTAARTDSATNIGEGTV